MQPVKTAESGLILIHMARVHPMDRKANETIERLTRERNEYARALQESNQAFMQKVKEFSIIKRNASLVLWNLDKRRLCLGLLEIIIDETNAENCSLWLVDSKGDNLQLVAAADQADYRMVWCAEQSEKSRILMVGEGAAGWVAEHGKPLLINDVAESPHYIELEGTRDIKSLLCLPVQSQGRIIGVLNLSHPEPGAFREDDSMVLSLITDQAALAFTNYFLFEEAQDFHRHLESMVTRRTQDLRRSQERFDLAIGSGKVGVWDWDMDHDMLYISSNLRDILGYHDEDLHDIHEWFRLIHPDDRVQLEHAIKDHLDGNSVDVSMEVRRFHRDGHILWFLVQGKAIENEDGRINRVIGSDTDITEVKEVEERLLYEARHDPLTGLPNRVMFLDWIEEALARSSRNLDLGFAVLCLDMDRFQIINDSLGHAAGDILIKAVSERLGTLLEEERFSRFRPRFARLGGDEFTVLIEGVISEPEAVELAREMHDCLDDPFQLKGHDVVTSISTGIVLSGADYKHPESIMRDADAAMNRAKAEGKACQVVFKRTMFNQALTRLTLESDLRRAVKSGTEFFPVFQPIISMKTGGVAGFEVLVRWKHPKRGMVMPGDFIAIAEETGLIAPLGELLMHQACREMQAWRRRFEADYYLSVNLSPSQLLAPDLAPRIQAILEDTGLPARALKLEITENVIITNFDKARSVLEQLRNMDIRLMLDDFGTGYSSLSYLHQLPLDTIKIDASFVREMDHSSRNEAIVKTICLLAAGLSMDVVAEGVETVEQMDHLRGLACDYCQGYLYAKPLSREETTAFLGHEPTWLKYI